jgi:hypothetical protein
MRPATLTKRLRQMHSSAPVTHQQLRQLWPAEGRAPDFLSVSSVCVNTEISYVLDNWGLHFRRRQCFLFATKASRPALELIQFPIQWISRGQSDCSLKLTSPAPSAEFKNVWACTCTLHMFSRCGASLSTRTIFSTSPPNNTTTITFQNTRSVNSISHNRHVLMFHALHYNDSITVTDKNTKKHNFSLNHLRSKRRKNKVFLRHSIF